MHRNLLACSCFLALLGSVSATLADETQHYDTVNISADNVNFMPSTEQQDVVLQYKHPWWLNVGGGLTTGFKTEDSVNPGFDISFNIQPYHSQLLSIRSAGADFIGGDYYDAALLYGLISKNRNGYLSLSTGVSAVFFENNFLGKDKNTTTAGVPIDFQAFWTPVPNFGLGVIAYANFNNERCFYGSVLALQFANLIPL